MLLQAGMWLADRNNIPRQNIRACQLIDPMQFRRKMSVIFQTGALITDEADSTMAATRILRKRRLTSKARKNFRRIFE
jgi:hypothetical protein